MSVAADETSCPGEILEFAGQAVRYVQRALELELDYTGDTLPLLDHYIRGVPADRPAEQTLVVTTVGAYFGEAVRRNLGGTWTSRDAGPDSWQLTLPGGLTFSPAAMVLAAITRRDDGEFSGPPKLLEAVGEVLGGMAGVTEEEYFSLGGRYDTLEHLQSVLLAIATARAAESATSSS
jgi:hypothetical protein